MCFFHMDCFASLALGWYTCITTEEELARWRRRKWCQPWYWCLWRSKNCWFWMWMDYSWLLTTSMRPYLLNFIMWRTTSTTTFCCYCYFPSQLFFFPFSMEGIMCLVCLQLLVVFCYGFLAVSYNVATVVFHN